MTDTPVTAEAVVAMQFSIEARGYDLDQVDNFLDEVAARLQAGQSAVHPGSDVVFNVVRRGYSRSEVEAFLLRIDPYRRRPPAEEAPKGFFARLFGG